ncbi:Gfo/Idh/MocA family oxidoreductase [Candidatus Binatia bacterium]|nr:Gfo/Idh/MocA family oxidoreductase [Candidatus Binatia bacterium]
MIRVGVIGLGYWGPNLVRNFGSTPRTRVSWLCDANPARLDQVGTQCLTAERTLDAADVLADPSVDAVAIATPVGTHCRLAAAAFRAGKHVLVEKPLAASVAEAEELVALANEVSRVLLVDHVFLYSPAVRKMCELVHSGEIGEVQFVDSVRINLGLFQHDVNVIWDLAPHDLAIIDHLIDRQPRSVAAIGASHAAGGREDVAYLHLDYGDNILASVHVNWLSPVKVRHFLVGGTRRSLLYNELDLSERLKVYDRGVDVSRDPEGIRDVLISYRSGDVLSPRLDATEPLRLLVEHFADCIEHSMPPVSGGSQGLRVVRMLEAAQRSLSRGGIRVDL